MNNETPRHSNKWLPVLYATYYGILKNIAEQHGYALAIHGSFVRDMDLIAVPWIDTAKEPIEMIREMCKVVGWNEKNFNGGKPWEPVTSKPHGRIAYHIVTGGGGYVDISVMPKITDKK